jgi:Fe-S cluster assembly scaffold protein SufB
MGVPNTDIQYRMLKHRVKPVTSLERSQKAQSMQVTENKIENNLTHLKRIVTEAQKEMKAHRDQLAIVKAEKKALINASKEQLTTEHARLRYCERYMGIDMQFVHEQILALPEADKITKGQTVITVYPAIDDPLNLAERETEAVE